RDGRAGARRPLGQPGSPGQVVADRLASFRSVVGDEVVGHRVGSSRFGEWIRLHEASPPALERIALRQRAGEFFLPTPGRGQTRTLALRVSARKGSEGHSTQCVLRPRTFGPGTWWPGPAGGKRVGMAIGAAPQSQAWSLIPQRPTLPSPRQAAARCQACQLWTNATQTAFRE